MDKCSSVRSFFVVFFRQTVRHARWVSAGFRRCVLWVSIGCYLGALTIDTFCRFVRQFVHQFVRQFVRHYVCWFVRQFVHQFVHPMSAIMLAGLSAVSFVNKRTPQEMSPVYWRSYFPWKFIISIV